MIHIEERSNKNERRLYIYINLTLESTKVNSYFSIYIYLNKDTNVRFQSQEVVILKGEYTQIIIYILVYNIVFKHFIRTKRGYVKKERIHILIIGDR